MTYFSFIQSVSASEYEAGVVLYERIVNKTESTHNAFPPIKVKSFKEMNNVIVNIANEINGSDNLIICIDAHSCAKTISFKDSQSNNNERCTDYVQWNSFNDILDFLYNKFNKNALIIFVSCYSASYFSSLTIPHINVIASEGKVNAMRAKELLTIFYDVFLESNNIEIAYNEMIKKYPLEEEMQITSNFKSVLKLYK